jgi:hypothetical protein
LLRRFHHVMARTPYQLLSSAGGVSIWPMAVQNCLHSEVSRESLLRPFGVSR